MSRLLALSVTTAISLTTNAAIAENNTSAGFGSSIIDAAELGDLSKVQNLISHGANPNERGEFGTTPLMRAVHNNNLPLVNMLLSSGANSNIDDVGGATAVSIAAREGHNEILAALISQGANLNAADNEGFTPLMRATLAGNTQGAQALVAGGAKINAANNFGETALSQANGQGRSDIAQWLQANGADDSLKTQTNTKGAGKHIDSLHKQALAEDNSEEDKADIVIDFTNGKLSNSARAETYRPVTREVAAVDQKQYYAASFYVPAKDLAPDADNLSPDTIQLPEKPQLAKADGAKWINSLRQVARVAASPYQLSSNEMLAPSQNVIIDLGNFKSEEFANKKIATLQKSFPETFSELTLRTVARNGVDGVSYQINGGLTTAAEAANICMQLIASGVNCRPLASRLQSQQEFNNYSGDAASVVQNKKDLSAASPSPNVESRELGATTDSGKSNFEVYSVADIVNKYNSLTPAAGASVDAAPAPATTAATPTPAPLKNITAPPAAATPASAVAPTAAAAPMAPAATATTPAPAATPAPMVSIVVPNTAAVPADAAAPEIAPKEKAAPPKHIKKHLRHRRIATAGVGEPPKDLMTGAPLTEGDGGQFAVARPVRSADMGAEAPVSLAEQVWIKIGNFTNAGAAHDYWNNLRAQNSSLATYRVRTNTSVTRPDLTSIEIGPFAGDEDSKNACAVVAQSGMSCSKSDALPPRTVNDLPVASAYIDDHNMPLVENFEVGSGNWNIQLGVYAAYSEAQNAWENVTRQNKRLKQMKSDIVAINGRFRLRAGNFTSSRQADTLCDELRGSDISCIIIKN